MSHKSKKHQTELRQKNASLANEGGNDTHDRQPVTRSGGRGKAERPATPADVQKRSDDMRETQRQAHEREDQLQPEPRTPKGEDI